MAKKTIYLKESQLIDLIEKIILESEKANLKETTERQKKSVPVKKIAQKGKSGVKTPPASPKPTGDRVVKKAPVKQIAQKGKFGSPTKPGQKASAKSSIPTKVEKAPIAKGAGNVKK